MIKKTGVLLINLGTPSSPTPRAIRNFLARFLHDKRVIEISRWIWCPILHGIILPLRPRVLAQKYKSIWGKEGSPLEVITQAQVEALRMLLTQDDSKDELCVDYAMTYSEPGIKAALTKFQNSKIEKWIVLPLYPQNSATTIGPCFDQISQFLKTQRNIPEFHFISGYADFAPYIQCLKHSIEAHWKLHFKAKKLLISFHGLPERNIQLGDPYLRECQTTADLLAASLGLKKEEWEIVFQSRFGKAKWLQPYLEPRLIELARQGIDEVDIICPGFPADCLETLEEIAQSYQKIFKQAGGKALRYISALNASINHIEMIGKLISPLIRKQTC